MQHQQGEPSLQDAGPRHNAAAYPRDVPAGDEHAPRRTPRTTPWRPLAHMTVAALLAVTPLAKGADDELTEVQQLWVNSFDAEAGGDYAKALAYTRRIMKDAGAYYLPNLRMAWLNYLAKDYTAAAGFYREAARLSPGAVSALQGLMNCYAALKDADAEKKAAKAILLLDPMNYQANYRLAELNYAQQDYGAAGSYYRKLFSLYPEDLALATGLGWCYLNEGLAQDAAVLFNNVLVVSPNYLSAKTGLARCSNKPATTAGDTKRETK